ncbi:MAG: nucleoside triphosphate pyrophosphohydrolase, partial [Alphaproteobacteria bacterium]|nr:nucleoside triphosphate pyrophosphohydrolase [Alphaproteobacteria bacterium]
EEITELKAESGNKSRSEDELGDLLFAVVNLARRLEIDPERALRGACRKFERRFRRIEERLAARGIDSAHASLDTLEAEWQATKAEER